VCLMYSRLLLCLVDVASSFRQERGSFYSYMTTLFNITISFHKLAFFFPFSLFFLTGTFICLICTAYPSVSFFLPLSIVFFISFPLKRKRKIYFRF
jgi:hypothetical protein